MFLLGNNIEITNFFKSIFIRIKKFKFRQISTKYCRYEDNHEIYIFTVKCVCMCV